MGHTHTQRIDQSSFSQDLKQLSICYKPPNSPLCVCVNQLQASTQTQETFFASSPDFQRNLILRPFQWFLPECWISRLPFLFTQKLWWRWGAQGIKGKRGEKEKCRVYWNSLVSCRASRNGLRDSWIKHSALHNGWLCPITQHFWLTIRNIKQFNNSECC